MDHSSSEVRFAHLRLICDFGEMSGLFMGSLSLKAFLDRAVQMVARRMRAAVCSIYIYDEESVQVALVPNVPEERMPGTPPSHEFLTVSGWRH